MKYIDVASAIQESRSELLKKLPHFIIRWVEKIIYQDQINDIITANKDCEGPEFISNVFNFFNLDLVIEGKENLPDQSKCFFVANHPFGMIDGLVLFKIVMEKYGDLKSISNETLAYIPNLRPFLALANPYGKSPKQYILELEKVYQSEMAIVHFPAGEVSRQNNGRIQDCAWQKSFIKRAVSCQRDVVPIYFHGHNSRLFHGINLVRRVLGIKTNIELILLPHEIFNKRNKSIKVRIGKPIPWQQFDSSKSHQQWAQEVKAKVYKLADA